MSETISVKMGQRPSLPDLVVQPHHRHLRLNRVSKSYLGPDGKLIEVFTQLTLRIPLDGMIGILGESGCGKSTLLNMIAGLDQPCSGMIELAEDESASFPVSLGSGHFRRMAMIFQDLNLVDHLSAELNVALPLLCAGVARRKAMDRAQHCLTRVGFPEERRNSRPAQLSGGQRQRVAIARAIAQRAELVLADEPTGSLDPHSARDVMQQLSDLWHDQLIPVLVVTHNIELAMMFCTQLVCLDETSSKLIRRLSRQSARRVKLTGKQFAHGIWGRRRTTSMQSTQTSVQKCVSHRNDNGGNQR